jgi:hypothetical protein
VLFLANEGPPPGDIEAQVARRLASVRFDFVHWEAEALLKKLSHHLIVPQRYMSETARQEFVLDYLGRLAEIGRINAETDRAYTDPNVADANAATAELRTRLAALREQEDHRQLLAEAIIEEQTATVLADEGFGLLGQVIPPVSLHFTPLPSLIVVSPRDHIENVASLSLRHGLDTAQREQIEAMIDDDLGVSSLVTGIGGLAAYPAMLLELDSLTWVADVTAHEWTHHYLMPRPLGRSYGASADTRTINETVASIVGAEIKWRTIARYYPQFLPTEPQDPESGGEPAPPPEPPAFDFRAEMRETRILADELLAEGRIEEAETYMEERRQTFVANGYSIRKLNQAYFAFHGSYAAEPGAAGADPVGPVVLRLRALSPDLATFVKRAAHVTTLEELESLLADLED